MNARERAFRKELLLVKGDALRMQLRMEADLMRRRASMAGMAWRALAAVRSVLDPLSGHSNSAERRWRTWLRTALRGLLAWQGLRKLWGRL